MNKEIYLHPGMIFAQTEPHLVSTVLGSCISVCLWDARKRVGGINHYLLPLWNGEGLPSPRYGNIAIQKLLEKMLSLGCEKRDLRAKVFGGGSMMDVANPILNIGGRNILLAENMLADEGIEIMSFDVGGSFGRKLVFNTFTGVVKLKRLPAPGNRKRSQTPLDSITLQAL